MHPAHFRRVVSEVLAAMGPPYDSPAAEELLMLTAAKESRLGEFLWQAKADGSPGGGPALGPFQMEPRRFVDTVLRWPTSLERAVARACSYSPGNHLFPASHMATDLRFAAAMARAAYRLIPEPLPAADDIDGLASYWHRHWCRGCRGTVEEAIQSYRSLVLRKEKR